MKIHPASISQFESICKKGFPLAEKWALKAFDPPNPEPKKEWRAWQKHKANCEICSWSG